MRKLILLAFVAGCATARQPEHPQSGGNRAVADRLIECSVSHATSLRIRKAAGQNVEGLYAEVGYYLAAGQAFSSKAYANAQFDESRRSVEADMARTLSVRNQDHGASIVAFMSKLNERLAACTSYQRENRAVIGARIRESGVLQ